jgi:hypothetical protein
METMTTLENRPNTALLVVDVQNGVVERAPKGDAVHRVSVLWENGLDADASGGGP